jgi:hypothetical protein
MNRLLLFFILSAAFAYGLFASDSLPFPVSVGGQAAKDGTPFAKIQNPVAADAELSVESKDGMIIVNLHAVNAKNEPVPGSTPAVILLQGKTKTEPRQNNGWKEARGRKLRHERGKRRQDCQYPRHHQVAFVRENDLLFAADPKCFTIETAGGGRFLHDRAARWIPAKPVQSPPLLTPNF